MKAFTNGQTRIKNNTLSGIEPVNHSIGTSRNARTPTPHHEVCTHSSQLWHLNATAGPTIILLTSEIAGLLQCGQRYIPRDFKLKLPPESIPDRRLGFLRLLQPGVADFG